MHDKLSASARPKTSGQASKRLGIGSWTGLRRRVLRLVRGALILGCDLGVTFAPTRWLVAWWVDGERDSLQRLGFEADFYLRQLRPSRRARAAHAPALHYLLVGWRERRSPSRRCDPVFVSARYPGLAGNPYLRVELSGEPRNDLEALGRDATLDPLQAGYALVVHHARGGGSTKCLGLYEKHLEEEGLYPLRLRLVPSSDRLVVMQSPGGLCVYDLVGDLPGFLDAHAELPICRLVVSHVVDFDPTRIFGALKRIAEYFNCPIELILHDYIAVCPRINLVDDIEQTCSVPPAVARCRACVSAAGSDIGAVDPAAWRSSFADLAASAVRVVVLCEDMQARLATFLPGPLSIWRPEVDVPVTLRAPVVAADERLRIAVVGAVNVAKGSKVLAALGAAIQAHQAPIAVEVFGDSPEREQLLAVGITVHGWYREADLPDLLSMWAPHASFIPAIWPETWSFVLTNLVALGLPVFSFAHGAQAERLRAIGRSNHLIPCTAIDNAESLLDFFLQYRLSRIPTEEIASCDHGCPQAEMQL